MIEFLFNVYNESCNLGIIQGITPGIKQDFVLGIIKTLIDGIVFISNMENVLMENVLMQNLNDLNFVKIKENKNFKTLINYYILEQYFIFNNYNNVIFLLDNKKIYYFIQIFLLNFEIFLIGIQKLMYEYIDYIKLLYNWYSTYKLLINKNIINTNLIEDLYYNISLELLLDIQNENNNSLIWLIQNINENDNLNKDLWINIFKNFNKIFKQNPYKINMDLLYLYKKYPKLNILSYGLNYDLNILTYNKPIINILNENSIYILKNINNAIINKSIKNWNPNFEELESINDIQNVDLAYQFFIDRIWSKDQIWEFDNYLLKLKKKINFYMDWNEPSVMQYDTEIKYFSKIKKEFNKEFWEKKKEFERILSKEKKIFEKIHKNDKNFIEKKEKFEKYFIKEKEQFEKDNWYSFIEKQNKINLESYIKEQNKIKEKIQKIQKMEEIKNINKNIKIFGGYSNWWSWKQDFIAINKIIKKNLLNEAPTEKNWMYTWAKKYLFVPHNFRKFNFDKMIDDFNNKNFLMHNRRPTLRDDLSTSEFYDEIFNPETNIFNQKLIKNTDLIKKKKLEREEQFIKNRIKNGLDENLMLDSNWDEMFSSKKGNPKFNYKNRFFFKYLEERGEYKADDVITHKQKYLKEQLQKKKEIKQQKQTGLKIYHTKEAKNYKKLKAKDPLNLSGKVRSHKGMLIEWGKKYKSKDFIIKGREEWSIELKNYKFPKENTYKGLLIKRIRQAFNIDYHKYFTKRFYKKKNINIHGYKSLLMDKILFKNILLSNDISHDTNLGYEFENENILYTSEKFLNSKKLRENILFKNVLFDYWLAKKYDNTKNNSEFQNLKHLNTFFIKQQEDRYSFINLYFSKPNIIEYIIPKISAFRGKGKYREEYWIVYRYWKNWILENKYFLEEKKKNNIEEVTLFNLLFFNKENLFLSKKAQMNIYEYLKNNSQALLISKNMRKSSLNMIHGSWIRKYIIDVYINTNYIMTKHYMKKNINITWDTFYTNIENISESLNLNIINKNIYGIHLKKNKINSINIFINNNELVNNIFIPKNTNILLKKNYIENLIYVYQKEEKPIINYILYKIRKEEFKILIKSIIILINNIYNNLLLIFEDIKDIPFYIQELIVEQLIKNKQIKFIIKYYQYFNIKEYYKYLIIGIYIFLYCVISSLLIILIKGFLPKNLIYGIKIKKKWQPINEIIKFIEDINIEDIKKQLYQLENIKLIEKNIKLNKKKKIYIYKEILKNIKEINEINIENIKKLEIQRKLKNIKLKKNFFDSENRYIYSWEKGIKNFKKIKIDNKFEKKKKEDLKKNYIIFYKKFIFEKNLEKWENNTKFRFEDPLTWFKFINTIIFKLKKLLEVFKKDRIYNHNRIVFWEDSTLDEWARTTYVYMFPKPFSNFFFIIKFIIGSIKLWNYKHWIQKWKQYVMYGIHTKINYKELKEYLEKEWTLEWYKNESDYSSTLYFKDMMKIAKKYNNIKKNYINQEIKNKKEVREEILENIINLIFEEDKLKKISNYLLDLEKIKEDRIQNNYNSKFIDISKKLIINADQISPKKWAEQELRFKYKDIIFYKKLELEKEEFNILKDKNKKIKKNKLLNWTNQQKLKVVLDQNTTMLEYEKNLRDYNFKNNIIDLVLDEKEKKYFESIKEYNEELKKKYLEIEKEEKQEQTDETIIEKKMRTLYGVYEQYYPYYRKWTTMGARMNYVLAQIIMIFVGWIDNIKKIRKSEYNIQNILKIIWIDLLEYIYKMYWEFMIIFNEYEALKKLGLHIKTILKFSLILTPILIYSITLYIILILFFLSNIIIKKSKNIIIKIIYNLIIILKKKINKKINKIFIKFIFFFKEIKYYIKFIINVINILFKDLNTGNTIFEEIYYKFYNICGIIQRNFFFIKGSFMLGYTKEKKIKKGLFSIKEYIILKYKSYIEENIKLKKKKKNWKEILKNKKENIKIKLEIFLVITNLQYYIKYKKIKILRNIHKYIIYPVFRIDWKKFYIFVNKNMELYKYINLKINEKLKLLLLLKKIKTWNLIKLIIINIWKLITLPISYIWKYQQNKYINNYKQGIQGFRENPMYLIIDKKKKKNDWKVKLHEILMEEKISKYLEKLLYTQSNIIEIFFMYKIFEVKWAKKNYYQDFFWRKWYWYLKVYKKKILNWLIENVSFIEESYQNFEENIETRNWTLLERYKYAYYTYKMYNHVMTRQNQKKISRDIFFYKKAQERNKLMRTYFIKGIINWFTYITINKIIYKNIKDLKYQKIKYKNFRYNIKNIKGIIHLSEYIEQIPPQLWALIIIYNKYYKYLLRYFYTDLVYPKKWEANKDLEYMKNYKWRLASPEHNYDIPFYDNKYIAADLNSFHFAEFITSLANQPYDPLIRWILFLLEYGLTKETLIDQANKIWIKENSEYETWGDISLTHLLTYDLEANEYKYEIKEFDRVMKTNRFFKFTKNTLEKDKLDYYFKRFNLIKKTIILKNKNILKKLLKERRLKKAKMLHKALLRNKLKTTSELEAEKEEENQREYFYIKKKEFFEEYLIEQYWDWQAQYDSKTIEEKHFNPQHLWDATHLVHTNEDQFLKHGELIDYSYLIDHIVLQSFDETMEEIDYFLKFKVWKVLEKILKNENKKKVINYKHLKIDENILFGLNYDDHLKLKEIKFHDKILKKDTIQIFYEYKVKKLEWETVKKNSLYGYIESNLILMYHEIGDIFTYEDKIKFNKDAIRYQRKDRFHEQYDLLKLKQILFERRNKLKDIKKNEIDEEDKDKKLDYIYINNIKWTWEQWLIYNNIEKEHKILNKKIIILNERYNIWNLKRVPIRIKLPVMLDLQDNDVYTFLKEKSNYMDFFFHRYYLMAGTITPILKQSLEWEKCKIFLEKHFNKDIKELMLWILTADLFNKEVLKIKKDYQFVLKNFTKNYSVFHKLYFVGMPHYSWDLIRYHEVWLGVEDFPYDEYFKLKQIEFLNHDPGVTKIVEKLYAMFLDRYKPISFIFFFKYQFFHNNLYHIYGILSICSFIWFWKILLFNPAEYLANHYMLFVPMLLTIIFWFLRKSLKDIRDISQGIEIYLYRYHSSKILNQSEWKKIKLKLDRDKKAWIEHFYDRDKIQEVFGPLGADEIITQRESDWWRYHSHLNKNNKIYSYKHIKFFMGIFICYFFVEYWKVYRFKFRNSKWIWEYYVYDTKLYNKLKSLNQYAPRSLKEREWLQDSWTRLENGGNLYVRWYENFYREMRNLPLKPLDYGFDWQKVADDVNIPTVWKNKLIDIDKSSMSDIFWIYFSRRIQQHLNVDLNQYKSLSFKDLFIQLMKKMDYRRIKGHKKIVKGQHFSKQEFIIQHKIMRKDHRILKEDYSYMINDIDRWGLIKKGAQREKWILKEKLRRIYLGDKYIHKNNPYQGWFKFVDWVEDKYNYKLIQEEHIYSTYLLKSKIYTEPLLLKDLMRYRCNIEKDINIVIEYNKQMSLRQKEIDFDFHNLNLNIRTLLSITEKEKHYHNLYYHLLKYKLDRLIILQQTKNYKNFDMFLKQYNIPENWILKNSEIIKHFNKIRYRIFNKNNIIVNKGEFDENTISILLLKRHNKIVNYYFQEELNYVPLLKKYSEYIKKINKKISKSEIVEYKCNLLINFIKEKKDFFILIKDFTQKIDLVEFLLILIKMIIKIWM